jgi:hypothetical protein
MQDAQHFYSIVDRSIVNHVSAESFNDTFAYTDEVRAPKPADSARQGKALQELEGSFDGPKETQGRRLIALGDVVRDFLKVFDRLELPEDGH